LGVKAGSKKKKKKKNKTLKKQLRGPEKSFAPQGKGAPRTLKKPAKEVIGFYKKGGKKSPSEGGRSTQAFFQEQRREEKPESRGKKQTGCCFSEKR